MMTNLEKIKSMDIVELSEFMAEYSSCLDCVAYQICDDFPNLSCNEIIEEWLNIDTDILHAKWLPWENIYECSRCGFGIKDNTTEYCPNCSARMDRI